MKYEGWSLYDKVAIVTKTESSCNGMITQGYVVNPSDKAQMERAIQWGTRTEMVKDETGAYVKDERGGYVRKTVPPTITLTENKGFKLSIYSEAGSSSQGGRLSFWNCLIEKEGVPSCLIGVDSGFLVDLMKQSNFYGGTCDKEISFARCRGQMGVLHEGMREYRQALQDGERKKNIGKGNTSKWIVGCNYQTLTSDVTYLGEIYAPVDFSFGYDRFDRCNHLTIEEAGPKRFTARGTEEVKNMAPNGKISEYFEALDRKRQEKKEELLRRPERNRGRYDIGTFAESSIGIARYAESSLLKKLPSRKQGELRLQIDIDPKEAFNNLMEQIRKDAVELMDAGYIMDVRYLPNMFFSQTPVTPNDLTDAGKELLSRALGWVNLASIDYSSRVENNSDLDLDSILGNGRER